ncbi:pentatricopeptide repeat-containing protein At4g02750-like [Selaginella moellendorffii]|uniref:pentatricopeptide repeat-containing protein At4g02750-like n=1 Tax=Selaginella moellendorffii TaxID=88036 RepID=UPI000D1CFDAD|nr:pentatricopeptide repeat-containing protein At4g02750-like [Selaginella moellendorffii]|eukprot:XP_024529707.1 pentatricopeptide repeat-containing protein At4g02750-like [Selaginella moellendorffii]
MYARCGSLDDARRVFNRMKTRDAFSCNAIIAAFTQHGRKKQALRIYRRMEQEGIPADGITFVSVLVACSHTSLVADCRDFFQSLVDHGVVPLVEHYLCMVDVLGRSGRLGDAEELVETMPYQADAVAWMTLPAAKRFDDARKVRKEMEERRVTTPVAVSYIEIDNELHMFTSGGRDEQQEGHDGRTMERVRFLLLELLEPMNHRVCSDCHSAIKLLSDITERRIFVRDGSRFYHFEKAACSCGDHW